MQGGIALGSPIEFKGTINGIVLWCDQQLSFETIVAALDKKLEQANAFFSGAHIIGCEGYDFTSEQELIISRLIQQKGGMKVLTLERVNRMVKPEPAPASQLTPTGEQLGDKTNDSPQVEVLATRSQKSFVEDERQDFCTETLVHRGTLRSGRRLEATGHLVLLGDANPGSELSAGGHIIVMGALRGFAQAGKGGDDSSYIVALKLQPTQLRIGSKITRPPDDAESGPDYPEIAWVKDGHIIIEPYNK